MDKLSFRKELKARRKAMAPEERARADAAITEALFARPEWAAAKLVLPYLSFGPEVSTRAIIERAWAEGKRVALPRVVVGTRDMAWYEVDSFDGLVMSSLGVEEPLNDPERKVDPMGACAELGNGNVLALVPGLAFDNRGYRIGYGGGFYDAFLLKFPGVSVGLCRKDFLYDELPFVEVHDYPVRLVLVG